MNVFRVLLHPEGLAPRIVGFEAYSSHLLARLQRDAETSADPELFALLDEVAQYPGVGSAEDAAPNTTTSALSLRLRVRGGELAFITTIATFGTPFDVTVSELVIESLFPADEFTAQHLRARALTSEGSAEDVRAP